jgi:hypothetical protein
MMFSKVLSWILILCMMDITTANISIPVDGINATIGMSTSSSFNDYDEMIVSNGSHIPEDNLVGTMHIGTDIPNKHKQQQRRTIIGGTIAPPGKYPFIVLFPKMLYGNIDPS